MRIGVCCQFEGRFAEGAGVLVNSLYRWGYRGAVYIGVRGELPTWLNEDAVSDAAPGLEIIAVKIDHDDPLIWSKPRFVLDLWSGAARDCEYLFYFDADVTLVGPWQIFESWAEAGIAVCADVNPEMPAGHPFRRAWRSLLDPDGVRPVRSLETYYNAGFLGLRREHRSWLELWTRFNKVFRREESTIREEHSEGVRHAFSAGDQDAFNAALMFSDLPISAMGRDGMGFQPGGGNFVMAHSVGVSKPWNACLVGQALRRRRPALASRAFVANLTGPIRVAPASRRFLRRADLALARAIGALIGV